MTTKRAAFIVEHDFIMATYLADKVIVFDGVPAKDTECHSPESMISGMNKFLKMMEITFRRDPTNFRPRINKHNSQKDQEQKLAGNFFLMDNEDDKLKKARELLAQKKIEEEEEAQEQAKNKGKGKGKQEQKIQEPAEESKKAPKKGKKKAKQESDDEWV